MRPVLLSTLLLVLSASALATPRFTVKYDAKVGALSASASPHLPVRI